MFQPPMLTRLDMAMYEADSMRFLYTKGEQTYNQSIKTYAFLGICLGKSSEQKTSKKNEPEPQLI